MNTSEYPVIVLLTVNDHETDAVLDAFIGPNTEPEDVTQGGITYFNLGIHGGHQIYHASSLMGSGGLGAAQQSTTDVIKHWSPAAVIAVGIAFGIDEERQKIGDVLVGQQLQSYELGRVGKDGTLTPRGDKVTASTRLLNRIDQTDAKYRRVNSSWPKIRKGLLLSGEKLIDNEDYRSSLKDLYSEAIGGEMEGAGIYVSAQHAKIDWLVVKAICDWGHNKNQADKDAWQKQAAKNAAHVVKSALERGPLYESQETSGGALPLTGNSYSTKRVLTTCQYSPGAIELRQGAVLTDPEPGTSAVVPELQAVENVCSDGLLLSEQYALAKKQLLQVGAAPFIEALRVQRSELRAIPVEEIVDDYFKAPIQEVSRRLAEATGALNSFNKSTPLDKEDPARQAVEKAATALFFLLASRVVAQAEEEALQHSGKCLRVSQNAYLFSAVIHVALFNGKVDLIGRDANASPNIAHMPKLNFVDQDGNGSWQDRFWRAAYVAICEGSAYADEEVVGSSPLSPEKINELRDELEFSILKHPEQFLGVPKIALVIPVVQNDHKNELPSIGQEFSQKYQTPVFLHTDQSEKLTLRLVGMTENELITQLKLLFKVLWVEHKKNHERKDGAEELNSVLQAIAEHASRFPAQKNQLSDLQKELQAEHPDKNRIKQIAETLTTTEDALKSGEGIVAILGRLVPWLGSLL